ncbi:MULTISPECIES: sigma-70 family RNA polymerase sigma factor [Ferrimonas]|uniref:sigma-70 family RNA polymerase sigma factor n=1 Tax=Ferrimonas TaxID=44011 RepID=UPI000486E637|nr:MULTISPECIES: sigma-70 family RNA polymerase sigma factor [Ferrimonas]USD36685.1 sigma-70 family RNA polymerase sigma factor [Ferrimonas sp. SCSIO 43195]
MLKIFRKKTQASPVLDDMVSKQKRYESLVRALNTEIYRYAYWLSGNPTVAEDLVQETFLRAWKALDSLKDDKAAKAWLITILRRENARRFERKQLDVSDIDDYQVADNHATSNEQLVDNALLRKHIAALAEDYREPLVLQVLHGFNGDEIAEIMGLNRNTVMTRLFRARNQLRERLEDKSLSRELNNG